MDGEEKSESIKEEKENKVKIAKYDPERDSLEELEKAASLPYLANKDFFGTNQEIIINFLYSRKEMDEVLGFSTPDWLVGSTPKDAVNIFSPSVFDKVSSHPVTNFPRILTHEIAHVYINRTLDNKGGCPKWFREGLCGYVAEQYKRCIGKKIVISQFSDLTYTKDWDLHPNYDQAFSFTQYLVDKYKREKILSLLKATKNINPSDFPQTFKEQLGDGFYEVADQWKKIAGGV